MNNPTPHPSQASVSQRLLVSLNLVEHDAIAILNRVHNLRGVSPEDTSSEQRRRLEEAAAQIREVLAKLS